MVFHGPLYLAWERTPTAPGAVRRPGSAGSAAALCQPLPAAVQGRGAAVKAPLQAHLDGHHQQHQHDQHQPGCKGQGGEREERPIEHHRHEHGRTHGHQQHQPLGIQGSGSVVDHHETVYRHQDHADGGELCQRQVEGVDEQLRKEDDEDGCETAGKSPPQHIVEELALHQVVVGLQRQEEGGHADGQGGDQRQLDGNKGIGEGGEQGDEGQKEGQNVLHQVQCRGPLDIVDDPAALRHHLGHGGKVTVQQHQLGHLAGGIRAGGHGHAAVGVLQCQHVIHTVAGHGHRVALALEGPDDRPPPPPRRWRRRSPGCRRR